MRAIWLAASIAVGAAGYARGAPPPVSPGTEARLDALLADILGHGRGHAFVRLIPLPPDVTEPPPAPPSAQPRPEPSTLWERIGERGKRTPPVLPGFAAPRSLREEALQELFGRPMPAAPPAAAPPPDPGFALAVTLLLDDSVSDGELKAASDAVARALGLAAERGDTLRASRAPLTPTLTKVFSEPGVRSAAAAGGTAGSLALVGLALVALALRGRNSALRSLLIAPQPAVSAPPVFHVAPPAAAAPDAPAPPAVLPPLGAGGAAACAEFLRDGPAAAAEWLLRRATPSEAAAVYERLPRPVRLGAARLLADAAQPAAPPTNPAELAERAVRRVSGLERLEDILLRLGPKSREEACEHLRLSCPGAAGRLNALPLFPELALADVEDLRLCLSAFSTARLAAALGAETPAVRVAFLEALPGVAADLVRERLAREPSGGAAAQGEILARWRGLERAGRVRALADAVTRADARP